MRHEDTPSSPKSATRKQLHEGRECVSSLPKPSAWQCSIDEWCPGSSQKRHTHRKQAKLLRVTRVIISGQTSCKMKKDKRADLPLGGQTSWWQRQGMLKIKAGTEERAQYHLKAETDPLTRGPCSALGTLSFHTCLLFMQVVAHQQSGIKMEQTKAFRF